MSSSDSAMFEDLKARVAQLELTVLNLVDKVFPKDMNPEIYGPEVDHTEERAERSAIAPRRKGF